MPQIHDISARLPLATVTVLDHLTGKSYRARCLPNSASIRNAVDGLLHTHSLNALKCSASVVKPATDRKGR